MPQPTRRQILAGSAIPFAVWLQQCGNNGGGGGGGGGGTGPTGLVRHNVRSTEGQQMLQTYENAVQQMMNLPESDPTGWLFQWYTHAVRPDQSKAAEIARVYPTPGPQRDLADEAWDTCQAHHPGQVEDYFLPWHRVYVYYLERIVRQVSGDSSFTLPYWNYSESGPDHGVLPSEFAQNGSSLFRANRNNGVNNGQAIDQNAPGALALTSLGQASYQANGPQQGFNQALDFGLHGSVHVLIGNNTNMGSVPWAARDPIFWMHHCNVDRLWASWNANGGLNPTNVQSWMDSEFVFADENGQRVVGTTSDFLDIAALGYSYAELEPAPAGFAPAPLSRPLSSPGGGAADFEATEISLGPGPVRAALRAPAGSEGGPLASPGGGGDERLYLVLRDLSAQAQPGVLYGVYLNAPENASGDALSDFRAGFIHFFDSTGHGDMAAAGEAPEKFASFDVTDIVDRAPGGDQPAVTIAPVGDPDAGAEAVVGRLEIVRQ